MRRSGNNSSSARAGGPGLGAGQAMARAAKIAEGQRGLATRGQLREAGFSRGAIDRATRAGWLRRLHRGVYQVGPLVAPGARELAAVLACGPVSAVSHASAAVLHALLKDRGGHSPVDMKVAGGDRGRMPGIRPHRVVAIDPEDVMSLDGIPVITPLRTVVDLAASAARGEEPVGVVERVVARAEHRGLVTLAALAVALADLRGRPGVAILRAILDLPGGPAFTRSKAEEALLTLIREARLPAPEVNVRLLGFEVDFLWRGARVVVEVDGYAYHASRASFHSDRQRDSRLATAGYRVIRLTWNDITKDRLHTIALLSQAIRPFQLG